MPPATIPSAISPRSSPSQDQLSIARSTRVVPLSVRFCPLPESTRAEEASEAKDDFGGLLVLLDLVVAGDTLVVTHIDRLSRGLTYGLR